MLKINSEQMEVFESQSMVLFIKKSIPFLNENAPEFVIDKTDDELEVFIHKNIVFSEKHNITQEANVQKIMLLKIEKDFSYPLSHDLKFALSGGSFSENYRFEKFRQLLKIKNQRKFITLDDDL